MPNAITCDVDSTLAHTLARAEKMIDKQDRTKTDWLAYALACSEDPPTAVVTLMHLLARMEDLTIFIITYRPETARTVTDNWLLTQGVDYDELIMAPEPRMLSTSEYKVEAIRSVRDRGYNVLFHIDDYWPIGEAVEKELGIPTIIVNAYGPNAWKE